MSPQLGLSVTAMYAGVQAVESDWLRPLNMRNAIRIHPALEFFYVARRLGKPRAA